MTTIILIAAPLAASIAPKIRAFFSFLSDALNSFAEARMRNAVPEWALRQTDRELMHYRHLLHRTGKVGRDRRAPAKRATALRPGF